MREDWTFCESDCVDTECYRNKARILNPDRPHSFADFSKECRFYKAVHDPEKAGNALRGLFAKMTKSDT